MFLLIAYEEGTRDPACIYAPTSFQRLYFGNLIYSTIVKPLKALKKSIEMNTVCYKYVNNGDK